MQAEVGRAGTLSVAAGEPWPALPLAGWKETRDTLHRWTQVVGKLLLALAPPLNHWWHVTLQVSARGLTTGPLADGERPFQVTFDFLRHQLEIMVSDGNLVTLPLRPCSVAQFYREVMDALDVLGLEVHIWPVPVEIADPTPFADDHQHAMYDPEAAQRFWRVLLQADRVLRRFRSGFVGKSSPVHFFWGGFDLAVTRFSGRPAPEHPPVPSIPDRVVREAYSHEVVSVGFWPGDDNLPMPAFYAYAYPEPAGLAHNLVGPGGAYYDERLREFILPYDRLRAARDPDLCLEAFMHGFYECAAQLGRWDRAALEKAPPVAAGGTRH